MPSAYVDGLHYSYHTCGAKNTFVTWFDASELSATPHHLPDMIATVSHYVKSSSVGIEISHREFRGGASLDEGSGAILLCHCLTPY